MGREYIFVAVKVLYKKSENLALCWAPRQGTLLLKSLLILAKMIDRLSVMKHLISASVGSLNIAQ